MIRILLIRHGTTDLLGRVLYGRMPGVHLNADGCAQARRLAIALKERYRLSKVISSPLERAMETARFIADAQGHDIIVEERVNEINFGAWRGKPFAELTDTEDWKRYNRVRSMSSPPGGEFLTQVQSRALAALQDLVTSQPSESVTAVVSHGDVIRALLILFLGMPIDHIQRLEISPASLSEIALGSGQPRVYSFNQTF